MQNKINQYLWSQFGASIDMLENAIDACPVEVWNRNKGLFDFWYLAYHTIFWLDFYLTAKPEEYNPYKDFGTTEFDPEGILPYKVFTHAELKEFLDHCRKKCRKRIEGLTEDNMHITYKGGSVEMPQYELMLYQIRHVHHHTGQLNLLLRQQIDSAPLWVKRAAS